MKPHDRLSVTATEMAESGAGVAIVDGVEVHVPGLLPQESSTVVVTSVSRHHSRAFATELSRDRDLSPHRQAPHCPAFGRCGGCPWQHLAYPAQLEHKRRRVARALRDIPGCDDIAMPWPAPSEIEYRNKGLYLPRRRGDEIIMGARRPRSAEVVDTRGCRVVAPVIDALACDIGRWLTELDIAIDDDDAPPGALRYVLIRRGTGDRVLVGLVTRSPSPDLTGLSARLEGDPRVVTAVHANNDASTGAVLGTDAPAPLFGSGTIAVSVGNVEVEAGLDSFVQVNRAQAARLYAAVAGWAADAGARSAVDLYCGLGGFAFALDGIDVLAIDRSLDVERAARAARGRSALRFARGDAAEADLGRPDFVIVNPPRKGLTATALELVASAGARQIAYVSCAPESLARDLRALVGRGYRVARLQPVDLMPGTAQIETLVLLERPANPPIG